MSVKASQLNTLGEEYLDLCCLSLRRVKEPTYIEIRKLQLHISKLRFSEILSSTWTTSPSTNSLIPGIAANMLKVTRDIRKIHSSPPELFNEVYIKGGLNNCSRPP
jgi:hypothetical protein